jgi:arylformamidase
MLTRLLLSFVLLVMAGQSSAATASDAAPAIQSQLNIFYGSDESLPDHELQTLDVYWPTRAEDSLEKRPVIIYLHGGGWAFGDKADINNKADYFVPNGFALVSINYRLRWDYELYDQLEDVVAAIQWVRQNAKNYGLDGSRVVLMGHGSGGHLASLVGTDGRHLRGQGLSLKDIKAVVAIDSLSFDIPRVHKELGSFVQRRQHRLVFGEEVGVQREASPIHHVEPNKHIPSFALLYAPNNEGSTLQAQAFAKALIGAKVNALMIPGNSESNLSINVELGSPGDVPTGGLMAFLRAST